MKKFEYQVLKRHFEKEKEFEPLREDIEEFLNEQGDLGWECFQVASLGSNTYNFFFRREKVK